MGSFFEGFATLPYPLVSVASYSYCLRRDGTPRELKQLRIVSCAGAGALMQYGLPIG